MELLKGERPWCLIMRKRYFRNGKPVSYYLSSSIWKGIRLGLLTVALDIKWIMGRNSKQSFWKDYWLNGRKLSLFINIPTYLSQIKDYSIGDFQRDGMWNLPDQFHWYGITVCLNCITGCVKVENHIMFHCDIAKNVRRWLSELFAINFSTVSEIIRWAARQTFHKKSWTAEIFLYPSWSVGNLAM